MGRGGTPEWPAGVTVTLVFGHSYAQYGEPAVRHSADNAQINQSTVNMPLYTVLRFLHLSQ